MSEELRCADGGVFCFICSSAGKCLFQKDQSKTFMSRECPVTKMTCHNPECQVKVCAFIDYPFERKKTEEEILKEFYNTPWRVEVDKDRVIANLSAAVDRLTEEHHHRKHPAKALLSFYSIVTPSGDISVIKSNLNNMAQTITVPFGQNNVPGQLIPVAADGVTVEPISTINAGSEGYTSSDPTIATVGAVENGAEGQYLVSRVAGAVGTVVITHTAVNTDGKTITDVGGVGDTFIFQGQPTGLAQALTSLYGTPTP